MRSLVLLVTTIIFSQILHAQQTSNEYEILWRKVENFELDELPKSALELVNTISEKAKKEKNSPQIVKALLYTSKFALTLEEDAQLKIINNFKREIRKAEFPTKNVLESYLANMYWQHFQQNRYRYYNRTKTDTKVDSIDFRTWDLTTLFKEINNHFDTSLNREKELQQIKVSEFELLLNKRQDSEKYRPTLFDLLAHNALNFFKSDENTINRPSNKFEINDPELLCEAYQFTQRKLIKADQTSKQASALIIYQKLLEFQHRWKLKEALNICDSVIEKHPKSRGAEKCAALKAQIIQKSLQLTTEKNIPINSPSRILVNYKNYDSLQLTARIISQNKLKAFQNLYQKDEKLDFIKKLSVAKEWTAALKNENDYQSHGIEIIMPSLQRGNYIVLAESNNNNEVFAYGQVQVTDIAITEIKDQNRQIYQVVNRNNGKPIKEAQVQIRYSKNYKKTRHSISKTTDHLGRIFLENKTASWNNIQIEVSYQGDRAFFGDFYMNRKRSIQKEKVTSKAFVFTDRSIYRPGQTVHFKGILVETFQKKSTLMTDENVYVTLYDANYEEVKELEFNTNEYGSFSGEFILPTNGLTGQFHLEIDADLSLINSQHNFSVEEYKRPKFETSFEPITETFKINDSVTVHGKATAYAGSTITDAKVIYRVKRKVNYPRWYYWRRPYFNSEPQEITHGETITDASGNYEIDFKALPDSSVAQKDLPIFKMSLISMEKRTVLARLFP